MNLMVEMNSSKEMQVFFSTSIHLFVMLCTARSRGMFVNSEIASKESNISFLCYCFIWEGSVQLKAIVDMSITICEAIRDDVMHEFSHCIKSRVHGWYNDTTSKSCIIRDKNRDKNYHAACSGKRATPQYGFLLVESAVSAIAQPNIRRLLLSWRSRDT